MPRRTAKVLTVASVEKLRPPVTGRKEYFDAVVPGLCLRVSSTGAKSWTIYYRHNRRNRRYTIGPYPAYSLVDARQLGGEVIKAVHRGEDPGQEKIMEKRRLVDEDTIEGAAHLFIERYAKLKNKSWRDTETIFRIDVFPAWQGRKISSITRRDVIQILDRTIDRASSIRANRVRAQLSRFFNWCVERDMIDMSPVIGTRPPGKENARDRVLEDMEIVDVWNACGVMGAPFGPLIQLLLLTSQRRGELTQMRWSDIDFKTNVWSIPREHTKADRAHLVPLSPEAVEILRSIPKIVDNNRVFSSGRAGENPVSGVGKAKHRCDELSGVVNWRLHDLRRTAASGMARLGVPPHIVEKVQNRQSGVISGVSAVYNRYGYDDEKRQALNAWGEFVRSALSTAASDRESEHVRQTNPFPVQ